MATRRRSREDEEVLVEIGIEVIVSIDVLVPADRQAGSNTVERTGRVMGEISRALNGLDLSYEMQSPRVRHPRPRAELQVLKDGAA